MTAHALLSPSSSPRWLKCPHSKKANALPSLQTNEAADWGTARHEVAATTLRDPPAVLSHVDDDIRPYVEFVLGLTGDLYVEKMLASPFLAEFFGTTDALVVSDEELWIVDLKTGDKSVDPKNNSQLACYLELARQNFPGRKRFFGVIVQQGFVKPPAEYTIEELDAHWELIKAAAEKDYLRAGEWCRYCPLLLACKKADEWVWRQAQDIFDPVDPPVNDCLRIIALEPVVVEMSKQAKAAIRRKLLSGEEVSNWRLAQPLTNRKWIDEDQAKTALLAIESDESKIMEPAYLKSPAAVEKVLGQGKKEIVNGLVSREQKPIIAVLESSSLPRYNPVDVFEVFEGNLFEGEN